ncbi:MAG: phosphatase PAP2 family protein [Actinobacteria bacterium]|nr:phosphatase PAP2 family protein [Actinomycetota bacterium]
MGSRRPRRAALGLALLAGSWHGLRYPAAQRADVRAGDALRLAGGPVLDRMVAATTDLGSIYAVTGLAAALAVAGRRRAAVDVVGAGALAWYGAQLNKTRVRRLRPYEAEGVRRLIRQPAGSSFPSGHAAVGAAVTTVLASLGPTGPTRAALDAVGAYIAAIRVYVGVHYPTDVMGGAGLGLLLGAVWPGRLAGVWHDAAGALRGASSGRRFAGAPAGPGGATASPRAAAVPRPPPPPPS